MTRFKKLKGMKVEELAQLLDKFGAYTICEIICKDGCNAIPDLNDSDDEICYGHIKEWLEQEVDAADDKWTNEDIVEAWSEFEEAVRDALRLDQVINRITYGIKKFILRIFRR